jgi:hypothetical protein
LIYSTNIHKNNKPKIFIKKNIMSKARKEPKPKSNRKNWVKNNKRIEENTRILNLLLNENNSN